MNNHAKKSVLDDCENLFGRISPQIKKKIKNFLSRPTADNWSEISGIIINSNFETIWQALIKTDPAFSQQGRVYDRNHNIVKEWERIPTPFEVMQAIRLRNS